MCSICLPQSGQAPASHVSQPHKANSPFRAHSLGMPGLRAMQANPFIHDVNQQDASLMQSGETGYEVSTAKCRNNNTAMEWWSQTGSNRRPEACKATALPTELWPRLTHMIRSKSPGPASIWWAWEDSNFRPHAYQARALTN